MAKWKGEQVSRKRLFDLTANAEWRRVCENGKTGRDRFYGPFIIGGNKNSKKNPIRAY